MSSTGAHVIGLSQNLECAEASAGVVEVAVFLCKAEPQQRFAMARPEECCTGNCGYAGGGQQPAGLFGRCFARQACNVG
jgi:hypothetical protein